MWADKRFKRKWLLEYLLENDERKRITQGLHVLKKLGSVDGSVVKLVSDGHVSVPAEFTPAALHQFSQSSETDSPMQWNRCWIIVKKYSLKFHFAEDLEGCGIRLLIEDFSFWMSEELFRLKEDPIPCMEILEVKSMVKTMWEKQREDLACEDQSLACSSVGLSALLSQMNKDASSSLQPPSQPSQVGQAGDAAPGTSQLGPLSKTSTENRQHCIPAMPQFLTEDLIDVRRFLISSKDIQALRAIPAWQPGYILPLREDPKSTSSGGEGSEQRVQKDELLKITNRTLADDNEGVTSSNSQQDRESNLPQHPSTKGNNISVQVGDSLLAGVVEPPVQDKPGPEMKECCAQVGSSLLQNTELSQSLSQSNDEPKVNLPSDFIFHPYFLGDSSGKEEHQGQSDFKEPSPPDIAVANPQVSSANAECPFVSSTQKDDAGGFVARPDLEMSPVTDSQAEPRLQGQEILDVSFNENTPAETCSQANACSQKDSSPVIKHSGPVGNVDSENNNKANTTTNSSVVPVKDVHLDSSHAGYKTCTDLPQNVPTNGCTTAQQVASDNKVGLSTTEGQASEALESPDGTETREKLVDKGENLPMAEDSQKSSGESALSNLGQKISTTEESQTESFTPNGQHDKLSENNELLDSKKEDCQSHCLSRDKSCGPMFDISGTGNVTMSSPGFSLSPSGGNRMFMGLSSAFGSAGKMTFSKNMSPEERRLEMLRQVKKTSEAFQAEKETSVACKCVEESAKVSTEDVTEKSVLDRNNSKESDDDLVVAKVIRPKNRKLGINSSFNCSTFVELKVESLSESEIEPDTDRTSVKSTKFKPVISKVVARKEVVSSVDSDSSCLTIEADVHVSHENTEERNSKGLLEGNPTETVRKTRMKDKSDPIMSDTASGTDRDQNSATDSTCNSSPDRGQCMIRNRSQTSGVQEDILTFDVSDADAKSERKKKKSLTMKHSKDKARLSKSSENEDDGNMSTRRKSVISGKKRAGARNKILSSEDEDTDWVPSPAKQVRAKSRASQQPRFSFSKSKPMSESIQDMLGAKKSQQQDSSVLFANKTPKGKSGLAKLSRKNRGSNKKRLHSETGGLLLLDAPEILQSISEEKIKETEVVVKSEGTAKVVTRKASKNRLNFSSNKLSASPSSSVKTEVDKKHPLIVEGMASESGEVKSEQVGVTEEISDVQEQETSPLESITVLEKTKPAEQDFVEIVDTQESARVSESSPFVICQEGNIFKVSQPVVVLEPIDLDYYKNESMSRREPIKPEMTCEKNTLKQVESIESSGAFVQTGPRNEIQSAKSVEDIEMNENASVAPDNQEELYSVDRFCMSCDDAAQSQESQTTNSQSLGSQECVEKEKSETCDSRTFSQTVDRSESDIFSKSTSSEKISLDKRTCSENLQQEQDCSHDLDTELAENTSLKNTKDEGIPPLCSKSSEINVSSGRSVEMISPLDESVKASPAEKLVNNEASNDGFETKHQCEDTVNSNTDYSVKEHEGEKKMQQQPSTSVCSKHLSVKKQSQSNIHRNSFESDTRVAPDSLVEQPSSDSQRVLASPEHVTSIADPEKILMCSTAADVSPCESSKHLTFPTPEMSLQCGQRSRTCEPSPEEVPPTREPDDSTIICNLQKLLDEEIQREDEQNLLHFSFSSKTESDIREYFDLES